MAFDDTECAYSARELLTEKSQASGVTLPHIVALIPEALELWARDRIDAPRFKGFFTKRLTASANSGVIDLDTYSTGSPYIDLADIGPRKCTVYTSAMIPMNWVSTYNQLRDATIQSTIHPTVYKDGNRLLIRNTDGSLSSYSGTVYVSPVKAYPTLVSEIHTRARRDFIAFLADLAVGRYREMILASLKTEVDEAQKPIQH
jgi:hypothetical protein